MKKLSSFEDIENLRNELSREKPAVTILVSRGTCGRSRGADELVAALESAVAKVDPSRKVSLTVTGCLGYCDREPIVIVRPYGFIYAQPTAEDVDEIISRTVMNGEPVERLFMDDGRTGEKIRTEDMIPFYRNQERILLGANFMIDPSSIEDYVRIGGYAGLAKAMSGMSPEQVIDEVLKAGLRGRGGAGFPTGTKWGLARKAEGECKYVICNADEGDPGAYANRGLLEGNPHSMVEGMIIGAYAIGASEGYVYIRAEYPLAVELVTKAIEDARAAGLLGSNILGSGFSFDIKISQGGGAFVCGEETALMRSIEGLAGEPRPRPPYPANKGLWEMPTVLNNVETWANVPHIIVRGAEWFAGIGSAGSKGTKIFSLVGKVNNTGLVEVPMGITLREIVYGIGGGVPKGKKLKAVQTGGPSGGCIPESLLDMPVDYDELKKAGAIMGSGGMIVLDEDTCMVDFARFFVNFLVDESCGKCTPCREGLLQMQRILTDICEGNATLDDLDLLRELAAMMQEASLCALGQTAANPVLSTLRYFEDEYLSHIEDKKCKAATCKKLVFTPCHHTCPAETDAEGYILLIGEKRFDEAAAVVMETNPLPGTLGRVCYHPCEKRCRRGDVDEPIAICALKRFAGDNSDFDKVKSYLPVIDTLPQKGSRVAIVGSGPAGLTAAYYLARLGYKPVVFEALNVTGGMLRVGIPDYRLPQDVLDKEIERIKSFGVEIKTGVRFGQDVKFETLTKDGYKALLIATGAHGDMRLGVPGEELAGVFSGVKYLRELNLGNAPELGGKTLVIGGGNVAIDAARSALRSGCGDVTIVYRRTRNEMPASPWEIDEAEKEGIKFEFLTAPESVTGDSKVNGLKCIRMKLGAADESGRRRPVPVEGSEFTIGCESVIAAIGQAQDLKFEPEEGVNANRNGTITADEKYSTSRAGVFACGDAVTGPESAIAAIAAGRGAAAAIHEFCGGKTEDFDLLKAKVSIERKRPELEEGEKKRIGIPELGVAERKCGFKEVEGVLSLEAALEEAGRCLRCSLG